METSQILGWTATILFSIMIIPQIIKTIRLRDTKGVSLLLFIIFLIANIIALIYAIMINQSPLMIKYIVAIISTMFYIGLFIYYKKKNSLRCLKPKMPTMA